MSTRAVHWHEGMFLRPHHFQAAYRHALMLNQQSEKWDLHFNWGLRDIDLDREALANYRFVVRSVKIRLRDGTLVALPEDGDPPTMDLKPALEQGNSLLIYLGVPNLNLRRANAAAAGERADGVRYLVDTQSLEDENTGVNPQSLEVRCLNVKLLLSGQDHAGYQVLPLARVEKAPTADATPRLDVNYIPPLLACDAWQPLQAGILQSLYDRIGKKIELLANQVLSRGISLDSLSPGDPMILAQLRELNEAYTVLGLLAFTPGLHPLRVYLELCRMVGQLAVFGARRRPPDLPRYDHDDLAGCFYRVKQYLDALLDELVEPEYKERPFIGAGLRMQVALEPAWMESVWEMFIGVQSPLDTETCIRLLTRPGQLDMKIGSSQRVDEIFRLGQAGLKFTHAPRPPRSLPALTGLIYFQVSRESTEGEWQNVQRSLTLALRLNENLIAGNIQGQRVLTIRSGELTTTLQFTLYIAPRR
jgi:type VI secretion system protein ImpJ